MNRPVVAPRFCGSDCAGQIKRFLAGFTAPAEPARPLAGIVPHAGWMFSGAVAAKVITCFDSASPETFVLFGATHRGVRRMSVFPSGRWDTALGEIEIDDQLAERLLERCPDRLTGDPSAHAGEHAIEVQLPMIQHLYPGARVVPIAAPPSPDAAEAGAAVGAVLAESDRPVAVLGSTDLTHYGAMNYEFAPWGTGAAAREKMIANDRRIIDLMLALDADHIVAEAAEHHNACGAGAIAATIGAARAMGAHKGALIDYTTSHDVLGDPPGSFEMAVGYAGVVFGP